MANVERGAWEACPPGEIGRLAGRLRRRARLRTAAWLGPTVAVLAAAIVGSWYLTRSDEYTFAGITCSEVRALAADFAAGRLPADRAEQIRQHVAQCPACRTTFDEMGIQVRFFPSNDGPAPLASIER